MSESDNPTPNFEDNVLYKKKFPSSFTYFVETFYKMRTLIHTFNLRIKRTHFFAI